jgi:hypothetical protein
MQLMRPRQSASDAPGISTFTVKVNAPDPASQCWKGSISVRDAPLAERVTIESLSHFMGRPAFS